MHVEQMAEGAKQVTYLYVRSLPALHDVYHSFPRENVIRTETSTTFTSKPASTSTRIWATSGDASFLCPVRNRAAAAVP